MSVLQPEIIIDRIVTWLRLSLKETNKEVIIFNDDKSFEAKLLSYICKDKIKHKGIEQGTKSIDDEILTKSHISFISERENGIIAGIANKNQLELIRCYHKYGGGLGDLFPFAELYRSEILELTTYLNIDVPANELINDLSYEELEWASRENSQNNIIVNDEPPNKVKVWFKYTKRQKEIISKLHQIEKKTRHKKIDNKKILDIRITGLVR